MFKKKLAIFALALALSTGTAISAFADTSNKVAIENCGAYLFEWRPVDCGDGVAFAILVGGNTIQESDVILNRGLYFRTTELFPSMGNSSGSGKCKWQMGNPRELVFYAGRFTAYIADCTED